MRDIIKFVGTVLVVGCLLFAAWWIWRNGATDNTNNIEFITSHCYNGEVIDMQNEIGVDSVEDLRWYFDDNETIVIEYGKILLKYTIDDFISDKSQNELNSVFITTQQNPETLEFTLFWQGQEITKYVKK